MKHAVINGLRAAAALVTLSFGMSAWAASGYVSGKLQFWQKQGNYCPTGRDCTAANYRQADHFDKAQPLSELQVQVVNAADTTVVYGQGVTDVSGNYLFQWTTPSTPPASKVLWKYRQKDTRFELRSASSNGIYYGTGSSNITLTNGTTQASPQALPTYTTGSSASPSHVANLYDGAFRTWYWALSYSGLMQSLFTAVQVKAFDATSCPTSCANGATKTITIDSTNSALMPQGRIMHEMGHIANYLSKAFRAPIAYSYPTQCTGCGTWSLGTTEWASAAFEEGSATFVGDVAMYWHWAPQPTTCLSSSSCSTGTYHVETSGGSSCASGNERFPINVERYIWDVYDTLQDSNYADTMNINYWQYFVVLSNYASGFANNQADEPWTNSNYNAIDNYDGRSSSDFQSVLNTVYSLNSATQRSNNCGSL